MRNMDKKAGFYRGLDTRPRSDYNMSREPGAGSREPYSVLLAVVSNIYYGIVLFSKNLCKSPNIFMSSLILFLRGFHKSPKMQ